jgi:hypothetical protein
VKNAVKKATEVAVSCAQLYHELARSAFSIIPALGLRLRSGDRAGTASIYQERIASSEA